jgi:S-DNA-T family DNA segregation ATPase FtsK/SpoIIIE
MTFPLGSLRSDGNPAGGLVPGSSSFPRNAAAPHHPAGWRAQLGLLIGGVLWLLAVIALATHNAADAAFSTSGIAPVTLNKAGALGAWFSDLAFFVFGYSVWWAVAVSLRSTPASAPSQARSATATAHQTE